MSGTDDDKKRYFREVMEELRRREVVVAAIEHDLAGMRHRLTQLSSQGAIRAGDAAGAAQSEAYRRQLRQQVSAKEQELRNARGEVQRAIERKRMIEEELKSGAGEQ